jgi:hypothetical protein
MNTLAGATLNAKLHISVPPSDFSRSCCHHHALDENALPERLSDQRILMQTRRLVRVKCCANQHGHQLFNGLFLTNAHGVPRVTTTPEITGPVIVLSSVKNFCNSVIGALAT